MARKSSKLETIKQIFWSEEKVEVENIEITSLINLKENLSILNDERQERKIKHLIEDIVIIVILAVLGNANEWTEIEIFAKRKESWLKKFLTLENGIPSHDTIERVMNLIKSSELTKISVTFLVNKLDKIKDTKEKDILHIDGKTMRGNGRKESMYSDKIKPLHMVNVYSSKYGICIEQLPVKEKSNEITIIPELLDLIEVKNNVITWDALNTQEENVKKIMELKGDYVLALKGNQGQSYEAVKDYFTEREKKRIKQECYTKTVEKEHSAIITREYYLTDDIDWLECKNKWAGLKSIGCVEITTQKTNNVTKEQRYYIVSFKNDIELFSKSVRGHWQVENNLHWHLDFTFKEDNNTTMLTNAASNLQIIKKLVLNILNLVKPEYKTSLKNIRYGLSLDYEQEALKIFNLLTVEELKRLANLSN